MKLIKIKFAIKKVSNDNEKSFTRILRLDVEPFM